MNSSRPQTLALGAWLVMLLSTVALGAEPRVPRVEEVTAHLDDLYQAKSSHAVMRMAITTKHFSRTLELEAWSLGQEMNLAVIRKPAREAGTATLKTKTGLWNYAPRADRLMRIPPGLLQEGWMGSHFTNDDLVKETRLERHFDKALEKKWAGKDEAGRAVTFYRVRLTPRPTAPVAWGKIIYTLWEKGGIVIPTSAQYYRKAKQAKAARTLTLSGVKEMGGRQVPSKMTMTVARKPGEHTSITYKALKFDIKIPKSKFTEQALRK